MNNYHVQQAILNEKGSYTDVLIDVLYLNFIDFV